MNCFNCGYPDSSHIAMYCNTMPQKFLRCADSKCWAAARDNTEHVRGCSNRNVVCRQLSSNDPIHNTAMRIMITSENNPIKRFVPNIPDLITGHPKLRYRSQIAEDIEFEWTNSKTFEVYGPESMNFRILLSVNQTIVARFDVGYKITNLLMFPVENQPKLEKYRDATKMHQTVAILIIEPDETIEVETSYKIFRMKFDEKDGMMLLSNYTSEPKGNN